jgi:transcriptional regulator with PAS, ATPase and Fis domain
VAALVAAEQASSGGAPSPVQTRGSARSRWSDDSARRPSILGLPVTGADPLVDRIAASRLSVVITGETGAGKEVLAQSLHARSPRSRKSMVRINCAAICDSLFEGELFGYERGSFTGAVKSKMGLVEAADGGTLFLDEVAELSPAAQAKLLRVIETRVVTRLGSVTPRTVDVRFIAATNRDLQLAVDEGRFREDLRFRLDGIHLVVPPLRERPGEILPAALGVLREAVERDGRPLLELTAEAEAALLSHTWPGNFRELRNVMERAAVISTGGHIGVSDLLIPRAGPPQQQVQSAAAQRLPALALAAADERARILSALARCAGNQTRAAKALGISRRTLITRLEALNIARPQAHRLRVLAAVPSDQTV